MFGEDCSPREDDENQRQFSGKPPMPGKATNSNNSRKNRAYSNNSTPERANFKSKWEPRFSVKEPVANKVSERQRAAMMRQQALNYGNQQLKRAFSSGKVAPPIQP